MAMRSDLLRCEWPGAPHLKLSILSVSVAHHHRVGAFVRATGSEARVPSRRAQPSTPLQVATRRLLGHVTVKAGRRCAPVDCVTPSHPGRARRSASELQVMNPRLRQPRGSETATPLHAEPCGLPC